MGAAISSLKETIEGMIELDTHAERLMRLLYVLPGWSEKNVQISFKFNGSTSKKYVSSEWWVEFSMFANSSSIVHEMGVVVLLLSSILIIFYGLFVQLYISFLEIHQPSFFFKLFEIDLVWIYLNVQVQQKAIEVVTHTKQTATNFSKCCVVLCLAGECLPLAIKSF